MTDNTKIFNDIDQLITTVDSYKSEPAFSNERTKRQNKQIVTFTSDSEILRTFAHLIAYSQNSNSERVEQLFKSGKFDKAFENFSIDKVVSMNPCDIADKYWSSISSIRQQAKIFHIVSLARKIKSTGSLLQTINDINLPRQISTPQDIANFWEGFDKLQKTLKENKISFFQSTTSLLHFLLDTGYDCVKPDLVVMKVSKKLKIVEDEKGEKYFRKAVRTIQEYSIDRNIKPSVVDFYFLVDGGQKGAMKFVTEKFYN